MVIFKKISGENFQNFLHLLFKHMADKTHKYSDNVPGKFYVDEECILCSVCSDCAPKNFRMSDEEDHDICYKQPETPEELEQCYEALENCPVEAIGDDGDT